MKGEYLGICNRTACNNGAAIYYNKETRKYYCIHCAEKINEAAKDIGLKPLCEEKK